jgi:hypothetical protein
MGSFDKVPPNPNRPVTFDELMAADIVPELMYI